jgi:hypothetical protein
MPSILRLHLQYRLWISEMNEDINVLRIFEDYLAELKLQSNSEALNEQLNNYKDQFMQLRKELDELRHEMYLIKMKLAAIAKTDNIAVEEIKNDINHSHCKDHYKIFRKKFNKTKKEFKKFEMAG